MPKIDILCQLCGASFAAFPSQQRRFCSKRCWYDSKIGTPLSEEHRAKLRLLTEEGSNRWKGSRVGYRALHVWVVKRLGKATTCVQCGNTRGAKRCEWANISHEYRRDLSDYMQLCGICHRAYDRMVKNQYKRYQQKTRK